MTDFQALTVGALVGAMMRAPEFGINAEVISIDMDDEGHYGPSFLVRGKMTGEVVRVTVTVEP